MNKSVLVLFSKEGFPFKSAGKAAAMGCESRLRKLEQIVNGCRGSDWSALEGFQCSFIGTH